MVIEAKKYHKVGNKALNNNLVSDIHGVYPTSAYEKEIFLVLSDEPSMHYYKKKYNTNTKISPPTPTQAPFPNQDESSSISPQHLLKHILCRDQQY